MRPEREDRLERRPQRQPERPAQQAAEHRRQRVGGAAEVAAWPWSQESFLWVAPLGIQGLGSLQSPSQPAMGVMIAAAPCPRQANRHRAVYTAAPAPVDLASRRQRGFNG